MSIVVTSTPNTEVSTEAKAAVGADESKVEKKQSAPQEETQEGETLEASDASEETGEGDTQDGGDKDEAEDQEDRPKKKAGGFQKRIQKLTKRVSEFERERDYWKEQALKTRGQESVEAQGSAKKTVADAEPKEEDFETHRAWVEALTDWKVEQKLKAHEQKLKTEQLKADQQSRAQALREKVKAFAKEHSDFQELVDAVETPMSVTVEEFLLMDADNAPALMYELAKNPDEYERINRLPPIAAARELGKIEARLQSPKKDTQRSATKAPPPPTPISGKADKAGKRTIYDAAELSQSEYERIRREEMKQKSSSW